MMCQNGFQAACRRVCRFACTGVVGRAIAYVAPFAATQLLQMQNGFFNLIVAISELRRLFSVR